ncbi:MAG: alanine--tRNA ligase-related protein [Candidatus Aminicenantaceae bacterium]
MAIQTKRLYFDDPYQADFEAKVLDRRTHQEKPALILDQTCFYPEGGGQPADRGTLSGVTVLHVLEQDGEILHILEDEIPGDTVKGVIDWDTRLDHMQQHTGQHVLSQCFHRLLSGKTLSFHLGEKLSTLEIGLSSITDPDQDRIEACANRAVFQNREIKTYFVEGSEVSSVPLRRPPKKSGRIRVVEAVGFDYSACGGTHPRWTGEIGLIKILKREKIRSNLRFEFVCGNRALEDYRMKNQILTEVAARFSAGEADLPAVVDKLLSEQKESARIMKKLRSRLIEQEARDLVRDSHDPIILEQFTERTAQDVRQLALEVIQSPGRVVLFGLQSGERAHMVMARSEDIALDLRELIPVVSPVLNARGGGRPSLVELAGDRPEALTEALNAARQNLKI